MRLEDLERNVTADPADLDTLVAYIRLRERLEDDPKLWLKVFKSVELYQKLPESLIRHVAEKVKGMLHGEWTGPEFHKYTSMGVSFTISTFRHKQSTMIFSLVPGDTFKCDFGMGMRYYGQGRFDQYRMMFEHNMDLHGAEKTTKMEFHEEKTRYKCRTGPVLVSQTPITKFQYNRMVGRVDPRHLLRSTSRHQYDSVHKGSCRMGLGLMDLEGMLYKHDMRLLTTSELRNVARAGGGFSESFPETNNPDDSIDVTKTPQNAFGLRGTTFHLPELVYNETTVGLALLGDPAADTFQGALNGIMGETEALGASSRFRYHQTRVGVIL